MALTAERRVIPGANDCATRLSDTDVVVEQRSWRVVTIVALSLKSVWEKSILLLLRSGAVSVSATAGRSSARLVA